MSGVVGAAELRDLFGYTGWANRRILDATVGLEVERFGRDLGSSYPSIRETLAHIAESDWVWLRRWQGESPTARPDWDTSTHASISAHWGRVMEERDRYLAELDASALRRVVEYRRLDGSAHADPLWLLLLHVVNHSTYHRGQVTTMLRQMGAPTVSTDLTLFHRARAAGGGR